jgi:hypothetical protein
MKQNCSLQHLNLCVSFLGKKLFWRVLDSLEILHTWKGHNFSMLQLKADMHNDCSLYLF